MRVLVLGGYGLIGLEIARSLYEAGHEVIGVGRSARQGMRLLPRVHWMQADIATLRQPDQWLPFLDRVEVVVNAAGALQDGAKDNLAAIHHTSVAALMRACNAANISRVVQISAPGATADASSEFMRSKARGDAVIRQSSIDWIILRPGVVLAPNAYGGSALIRMLAALPAVSPLVMADARIQTVAIGDVCALVRDAVEGRLASGTDIDLVEAESHSLREVVGHFRRWLGAAEPVTEIALPRWTLKSAALLADALGHLGWRSPLRSNAMLALKDNVVGDASQVRSLRGRNLLSIEQSLDAMPATLQERWFASLYLLMPLMVATLAIFWVLSGVIGLLNIEKAAAVLPANVLSQTSARNLVIAGALFDILLGLSILIRPLAKKACFGMVAVALGYLAVGSVLTPLLWSDPLGPFVKVLPLIVLCLATLALLEER